MLIWPEAVAVTKVTSGTAITPALPPANPNDLYVLICFAPATTTFTWPAGWSLVWNYTAGTGKRIGLLTRRNDGTWAGAPTVTCSAAAYLVAAVVLMRSAFGRLPNALNYGSQLAGTADQNIGPMPPVAFANVPSPGGTLLVGAKADQWASVVPSGGSIGLGLILDSPGPGSLAIAWASWDPKPTMTDMSFVVTGGAAAGTLGRAFHYNSTGAAVLSSVPPLVQIPVSRLGRSPVMPPLPPPL